jgi:hypothetical protein
VDEILAFGDFSHILKTSLWLNFNNKSLYPIQDQFATENISFVLLSVRPSPGNA